MQACGMSQDDLLQCIGGLQSSASPPYFGTVREVSPNVIESSAPSTFKSVKQPVADAAEHNYVAESMYDGDKWDKDVPIFVFKAQFEDSDDVIVRCDQQVGNKKTCKEYAAKFLTSLGKVPAILRTGVKQFDMRPPREGCGAWGLSSELGLSDISTLGLCVSAGDEEIEFGTIEELMFHECGHLTVDPVFAADETLQYKWACAICADGNFISEYAQTLTQAEDIAESLVPWYAYATRDVNNVDEETLAIIEATIPNRMAVLDELAAMHSN